MLEVIVVFLTDNAVVIGSGAAALGIVEYVFAPFRGLRAKFKKPEKVEIANPEAFTALNQTPAAPSEPVVTLTLAQLDTRLDAREAEVRTRLENADAEDRALLQSQLDELANQKANIDKTLEVERARIADLEERLTREGNDLGGEKLAAARAALETGDYSAADDLFAEIEARDALAVQSSARAAFARGEIAEAEVRWADAAEHFARAAGMVPDLKNLFKARSFAWRSGDYPAALRFGEQALEVAGNGDNQYDLARIYNEHALTLVATGRYDEAESLYRQAREICEATLGKKHPHDAAHLNNLALLLDETGRYDEAEPLYREAIAVKEAALGKMHPNYANGLNNLAELLRDTSRDDEAEPLYREALAITEAALGKAHPSYATSLNNLAVLLADTGRNEEAEPLYRQAIKIDEAALGKEHPAYANRLNNLAAFLAETERSDEAIPLMEQALTIMTASLGEGHPDTVKSTNALAIIRDAQKD